jgi:hypothetical protein
MFFLNCRIQSLTPILNNMQHRPRSATYSCYYFYVSSRCTHCCSCFERATSSIWISDKGRDRSHSVLKVKTLTAYYSSPRVLASTRHGQSLFLHNLGSAICIAPSNAQWYQVRSCSWQKNRMIFSLRITCDVTSANRNECARTSIEAPIGCYKRLYFKLQFRIQVLRLSCNVLSQSKFIRSKTS